MNKLEQARLKINEIDEEMAKLFEARMQAVEDVVAYKKEKGLPILDTSRESFVIENNVKKIKDNKYRSYYETYMQNLMAISREYQKSVIHEEFIGYQGAKGAFSHIATMALFPDYKLKNYATFEDVFKAVLNNEIAYGMVPIQNTYSGEIGEVLDLLIQYDDLYIAKNYLLTISQNLLGIKGARLEDIKEVYSKDHAINQSKQFLQGRNYDLIPYPNTAMAAEYVAKCNDKSKAAIGSKENAKLYGLEILAADINSSSQNTTRFIALSKTLEADGDIFALAFVVNHQAGTLAHAMNIIASYGLNMQSIISRPLKSRPWEYYFYVEVEGNLFNDKEQAMIKELNETCEKVKILGNFKRG